MINKAKYLSLLVLMGAWGCTTNNFVSRSGGGYDDLYGGGTSSRVVTRDRNIDDNLSRYDNPDYSSTQTEAVGTADYYDDSYLSSRGVGRALSSNEVGYNAGFVDGYNQATRFSNFNMMNGMGGFWPGNSFSLNFGFGMGSMFRMRPYMGFGMGPMLSWGYSPWGFGSMMGMGYGGFGYDPFGFSPWGYSPFGMYNYGMYDAFGYGYNGFGYGYNPWAYSRPIVIVNNNERQGMTRSYGPRSGSSRSGDRYNSSFVNNARTSGSSSDRGGRRAASGSDTYVSPRSASRSTDRSGGTYTGGRTSAESNARTYSRGTASEGGNVYYSRPRSSSSTYSLENSGGSYSAPRTSRSSSETYSAPSRSQSNYSAPSRSTNSYSTPSRESYSAPSRTYSAPSAPSRTYSAPAPSSGGGGAVRSSSRGPR